MSSYLIVGASSGIGETLAKKLVGSGHRVFGTFRSHLKNADDDLLSYHSLDALEENVNTDFLPDAIDGLIYCPGSINLKPFSRIKPAEFAADYALQVVGAIRIIQAVIPKLKAGTNPSIILFSTVAVQVGMPFHSQVAASKGAIEGLVRALAAELAPSIRVNAIAPSLTDTPLAGSLLNTPEKRAANAQRHPLKKIGTTEDIADAACFLLSGQSAWMTGQVLHIDGGMSTLRV